jgi:hypothetical protein
MIFCNLLYKLQEQEFSEALLADIYTLSYESSLDLAQFMTPEGLISQAGNITCIIYITGLMLVSIIHSYLEVKLWPDSIYASRKPVTQSEGKFFTTCIATGGWNWLRIYSSSRLWN